MEKSIETARTMRPRAKWGYYGLPYCFNGRGDAIENCPIEVRRENEGWVASRRYANKDTIIICDCDNFPFEIFVVYDGYLMRPT